MLFRQWTLLTYNAPKLTSKKAESLWTWPIPSPRPLLQLAETLEHPRLRSPLLLQEPLNSLLQSLLPIQCLKKKKKTRAYIHDMWHLKPALDLKYNYGKTIIHDYTIYHISLVVASVWSGLAKGSRSYLGSSPSSESESAALLELSQVSVMSQVLLVAWLWEDCDPPNLETYEICTEYKTIILKQK